MSSNIYSDIYAEVSEDARVAGNPLYQTEVVQSILHGAYDGIENVDNDMLSAENLYVHGRSGQDRLSESGMVLVTQDMETAIQYSDYDVGRIGAIYLFQKPNEYKVLDLSDMYSTQMQEVVDLAVKEHMFVEYLEIFGEAGQPQDPDTIPENELNELIADKTRMAFSPPDIVDSAAGYDNPDFFSWFYDNFGNIYDFVTTPDGGVILNPENEERLK